MSRHVFITTARPGKLEEYIYWHDNIFPEVCAGLRAAGITSLTINNQPGTDTLVMSIHTAGDIDLSKVGGWLPACASIVARAFSRPPPAR
jgi:L-rhamnose mutarotase